MAQTRAQATPLRQGPTCIHSSFNNELHHTITVDIQEEVLASCDDVLRRTHNRGCVHLSIEKIHAPDACTIPWRAYPTPSTQCDACAHHLACTNGGGVRLHLIQSSTSIGGSVPPRTKVGVFAAPRTYEHHQLA